MLKKLVRHGNRFAIILDQPILQALNITEHTKLNISIEHDALIIKPEKKSTESVSQEIIEEYENVFDKLAK